RGRLDRPEALAQPPCSIRRRTLTDCGRRTRRWCRAWEGVPHYDILVDLWADVWGDRWPPYAPRQGRSECVHADRAAHGNRPRRDLDEEVNLLVLRRYGRYEALRKWASVVRYWTRRRERQGIVGVFPAFLSAETCTSPLQAPVDSPDAVVDVDSEVIVAGAAVEIQCPSACALERATWQLQTENAWTVQEGILRRGEARGSRRGTVEAVLKADARYLDGAPVHRRTMRTTPDRQAETKRKA
ncbi:unnamed protein product, partial [Ectocarpus sp. 12 AP-2014]